MTLIALLLTRSTGLARAALVAACTALVTALLLVGVAMLRLPDRPDEALFNLVSDPGVRPGTVLAIALLAVPPLLLLHQAVRLGTAARERRLAALRIAGATVADVRRIGAVEVGVPAFVGSLLGIVLYGVLRAVLGGVAPRTDPRSDPESGLRLVPTTVSPTWWHGALVVLGVTVLGVLVGGHASSAVVVTPLGVARRTPSRPPRPWAGLGLLLAAPVCGGVYLLVFGDRSPAASSVVALAAVAGAVLGMVALAAWAAHRAGLVAERRASSAAPLLAARRLVADPRPAGRAAAAVGGIALVSGGAGVLLAGEVAEGSGDAFYLTSLALVAAALLVALAVVVASLAVHSTETLMGQKRSMAALLALGASTREVTRSQLWELLLAALPVTVLGVVLGSLALGGAAAGVVGTSGLVVLLNLVLTPALVVLAAVLATALTRPLVRRATSPEHLRTE